MNSRTESGPCAAKPAENENQKPVEDSSRQRSTWYIPPQKTIQPLYLPIHRLIVNKLRREENNSISYTSNDLGELEITIPASLKFDELNEAQKAIAVAMSAYCNSDYTGGQNYSPFISVYSTVTIALVSHLSRYVGDGIVVLGGNVSIRNIFDPAPAAPPSSVIGFVAKFSLIIGKYEIPDTRSLLPEKITRELVKWSVEGKKIDLTKTSVVNEPSIFSSLSQTPVPPQPGNPSIGFGQPQQGVPPYGFYMGQPVNLCGQPTPQQKMYEQMARTPFCPPGAYSQLPPYITTDTFIKNGDGK